MDSKIQELFQDQPTPELEIDLEALLELSTEEQKTQLEVEWGTWAPGPQVGEWKLGLDQWGPRHPDSASFGRVGGTESEERIPGRLSGSLWKSAMAQ